MRVYVDTLILRARVCWNQTRCNIALQTGRL